MRPLGTILFRSAVALLLVVGTVVLASGGAIKDESLRAFSNGTNIIVQWRSDDEAAVASYKLSRKAGASGAFFQLASLAAKGSGQLYEFIDNSAFRVTDSFYTYEVKAVLRDGTEATPYFVSVNHSVSSVRRTWGSIKAMFR